VAFLDIKDLSKCYSTRRNSTLANDSVCFSAERGEIIGVLGPNGSGKTTTLKSILGLIRYDAGSIHVDGMAMPQNKQKMLSFTSAVLEGSRNIHWRLRPEENMDYFGGLKGISQRDLTDRRSELVEALDLGTMLKKEVGKLSRGYQQRVAIACALISSPEFVLLDEPTLGLDIESISKMKALIRSYSNPDRVILITSHDMKFIQSVCTRIILYKDGRIIQQGTTAELKNLLHKRSVVIQTDRNPDDGLIASLSEEFTLLELQEGDRSKLHFILKDEAEFYPIIRRLESQNLLISDVAFLHNDLEHVFVQLTQNNPDPKVQRRGAFNELV
jgi:ABC-2 type transport system ATP-binding protein